MLGRFLIILGVLFIVICLGYALWIDTHPDSEVGTTAVIFGVIGAVSLFTGIGLKLLNAVFNTADTATKSAVKFVRAENEFLQTDEGKRQVKQTYRRIIKAQKKAKDPLGIRRD